MTTIADQAKSEGFEMTPEGAVNLGTATASGAAMGTAIMPGWGTAIGAGIGLIGGGISNWSHGQQADKGYSQQERSLRNSIRWRVEDAKAAGIHPLYALGSAPMTMQPMTFQDAIGPAVQQMGQSMPDIIKPKMRYEDQVMEFETYRQMRTLADKNEAEAAYFAQLTANAAKPLTNINPPGLGIQHESGQMPSGGGQGMIDLKPAENISGKTNEPWSAAGQNPAYELRYVDKNLPMYVPLAQGDSLEETLSEMSFPTWAGLLQRNARIFGPGWMKDFINSRYMGLEPTGKYDIQSPRLKKRK